VRSPGKRQNAFAFLGAEVEIEPRVKQQKKAMAKVVEETFEQYQERIKDQVFRFMDLPGGILKIYDTNKWESLTESRTPQSCL
jgi:hypothetical protein